MQKAEVDWLSARTLIETALSRQKALHDSICFHCQQTAEKYLKALLQEHGQVVSRTHDLEVLLDQLLARDVALASLRQAATILAPHAVEYRYPAPAPGSARPGRRSVRPRRFARLFASALTLPTNSLRRLRTVRLGSWFLGRVC